MSPSGGTSPDAKDFFWSLATDVMGSDGVEEGTLMGMPCLRVHGEFLATYFARDDAMIVKLNEQRVTDLIAEGRAQPFAPAKKVFKEWAAVPSTAADAWEPVLREAVTLGNA